MHRVAAKGHDANLFTGGDLTGVIPVHPTYLTADWLNAIQEEIANLLEDCGKTLNTSAESAAQMKQLHDTVGQSWVVFTTGPDGDDTITILASQNVASVDRTANGIFRVYWARDFTNANYAANVTIGVTGALGVVANYQAHVTAFAVGYCDVEVLYGASGYHQFNGMRVSIRATGAAADA